MSDQPLWWVEIKPILGPLIQAAVVLIVGVWTIWFQSRQARTAERKLFTDLHDKRFNALSSFTHDLADMVRTILDEDDNRPPRNHITERDRRRQQFAKLEELTWLFGGEVIFHLTQMQDYAEDIVSTINRLRHNLKSDDQVTMVESLNSYQEAFYVALGKTIEAARNYLYVGHIKTQAPPMPAFTLDELKQQAYPAQSR